MLYRHDSERRMRRLIAVGFLLTICLLLADGFIGYRSIRSIKTAASELAEDQFTQMALIDEVQREQGSLSAIFYRLAGDPDSFDHSNILSQIETTERNIRRIVDQAPVEAAERETWNHLAEASSAFSVEARRLLALNDPPSLHSRELLLRHEEVVTTVANLIRLSHLKSRHAKERIEMLAAGQLRKDAVLLGGSLVLAILCAFLVVRTSIRLQLAMTEQSEELTRVSWRLLDNQEMVARRLSHELHDELGQALTALKTNFSRHINSAGVDPAWIQDCSELLKDSIRSAHEISQLLRPTILDDFGLDSALNWLCERFEDRNEISVEYSSSFHGRLPPQIETHMFRIAQEALTNVARHSGASLVIVRLHEEGRTVTLTIKDNGRGLPARREIRRGAFGLTGMQARAESSQGELKIESRPSEGTSIEVCVPVEMTVDEEKDPHPVG